MLVAVPAMLQGRKSLSIFGSIFLYYSVPVADRYYAWNFKYMSFCGIRSTKSILYLQFLIN